MLKPRRPLAALAPALLLVAWPSAAPAQDWLRLGAELLKGLAGEDAAGPLDPAQIALGLREALRVGSESVVGRLGQTDGFQADPAVHIPLPRRISDARDLLSRLGLGGSLDDLELQLNRAAELAVPRAKALFLDAISRMTLDDARAILSGPDDAATRYFQRAMGPGLADEMRPIVDKALAETGAIRSWEELTADVADLPFVPNLRADLGAHVVERAGDGVFHYLAREEAKIRSDPAARTTELLRTVFGQS